MSGLVFCDGMDRYGPTGNQNLASVLSGDWSVTGTPAAVAPLSAAGYAMAFTGLQTSTATLPSSFTRVAGSVRFQITGNNIFTGSVQFRNSGTAAFTINFNGNALLIELKTGAHGGTVVQSAASGALNTTHVLTFDVTIGASGAYSIYLDGASTPFMSGTGNTGNGQSSVNQIVIGCPASGAGTSMTFDDVCVFNPLAAGYDSSVLTASVVVETQWPTGDVQKQFTSDGNVVWPTGIAAPGVYRTASGLGVTLNRLYVLRVTPQVNCTLDSVSFIAAVASGAARIKGVCYSDSAGSPNLLLSDGTEVVGASLNAVTTLPLATPVSLTAGTSYWIGYYSDAALTIYRVDTTTALTQSRAATYTSGAPAGPLTGMTTGQDTLHLWGNATGAATNWPSVMLNPPHTLGSGSQVRGTAAAQKDLYSFPALSTVPSAIYGVAVKGFVHKSDSGARTVSLPMRSGATDSDGSAANQAMSTTGQWQRSLYPTDPATGAAWTAAGVNAASAGVSVAT